MVSVAFVVIRDTAAAQQLLAPFRACPDVRVVAVVSPSTPMSSEDQVNIIRAGADHILDVTHDGDVLVLMGYMEKMIEAHEANYKRRADQKVQIPAKSPAITIRKKRRSPGRPAGTRNIQPIVVEIADHEKQIVIVNGDHKRLGPVQYALLLTLLARPGKIVSSVAIQKACWPGNQNIKPRWVPDTVLQLKKSLGKAEAGKAIQGNTDRGYSIRLKEPYPSLPAASAVLAAVS